MNRLLKVIAQRHRASAGAGYDVFIIAGQSNAAGYIGFGDFYGNTDYGYAPPGLNEAIPLPDVGTTYYYDKNNNTVVDAGIIPPGITNDQVYRNMGSQWSGFQAGFAPAFAKRYVTLTGRKVLFVLFARGGSGIIPGETYNGGNWMTSHANNAGPYTNTDAYVDQTKVKWLAFKAKMASLGETFSFKGIIWNQGEAEDVLTAAGTVTEAQLVTYRKNVFDRFVTDYAADLSPGSTLVNVMLTGIVGGDGGQDISVERIADKWWWKNIRRSQITAATTHANARLVFYAAERFLLDGTYPNIFWNNGFRGRTELNSVHWDQSQYNEAGVEMADELAGATHFVLPPTPTGLTPTVDGPWRVKMAWTAPTLAAGSELKEINLYRRVVGDPDWTLAFRESNVKTWDGTTQLPATTGVWDENGLRPATAYEYRLGNRNEYGESYSSTVTATTASLAANIKTTYATATSCVDTATVNAIYDDLDAGGYLPGLRSLHIMTAGAQGAAGTIYNLMRTGTGADRYDMTETGLYREASAFVWEGLATAQTGANGLIPATGRYTAVLGHKVDAPIRNTSGSARFLEQSAGTSADAGLAAGDTTFSMTNNFSSNKLVNGGSQIGITTESTTASVATQHISGFKYDEDLSMSISLAAAGAQANFNGNKRRPHLTRKLVPALIQNRWNVLASSNLFNTQKTISAFDLTANTLTVTAHGLSTGDPFWVEGGNLAAGGLAAWPARYYAIITDANTIQVAASPANATAGTAVDFPKPAVGFSLTNLQRYDHKLRMNFIAVWNRGLTTAEYLAVRTIFNTRLGLGL